MVSKRVITGEEELVCLLEAPAGKAMQFYTAQDFNDVIAPEVSAEEIIPSPEDYFVAKFRMLSNAVVGSGTWKSTDFRVTTDGRNLLKENIAMFADVPIYLMHWTYGFDPLGIVKKPYWEESFTDDNGNFIPAGVVGYYCVDKKLAPDTIRRMNVPGNQKLVDATSVGIRYKYRSSHDFESEREFRNKVGQIVDGREVSMVPTAFIEVRESSFVDKGADPYSTGRGVVGWGDIAGVFSAAQQKKDIAFWSPNRDSVAEFNANYKSEQMNQNLVRFAAKQLGIPTNQAQQMLEQDDFESANFHFVSADAYQAMQKAQSDLAAAVQAKDTAENARTDLEVKLSSTEKELKDTKEASANFKKKADKYDASTGLIEWAEADTKSIKGQAVRHYRAKHGAQAKQSFIDAIENSTDREFILAQCEVLGLEVSQSFGAKCTECGSEKFTYQRSSKDDPQEDQNNVQNNDQSGKFSFALHSLDSNS